MTSVLVGRMPSLEHTWERNEDKMIGQTTDIEADKVQISWLVEHGTEHDTIGLMLSTTVNSAKHEVVTRTPITLVVPYTSIDIYVSQNEHINITIIIYKKKID